MCQEVGNKIAGLQFHRHSRRRNQTGTPATQKKVEAAPVAEKKADVVPLTYALNQKYPNPFNPETTIKFEIPKNGKVKLNVYNIDG